MGYMVFDIGGSAVKYGYATEEGELSNKGSFPSCQNDFSILLEAMGNAFDQCEKLHTIEGIAVSAPGFVDCEKGIIGGTSALPCIHGFPVIEAIRRRMAGLPAAIENDGNCGALGEYWKGAGAGKESMAMLVCGSGIGGGYVNHGSILRTAHHSFSEFGFMPLACEDGRTLPWSDFSVVNTAKRYNQKHKTAFTAEELFDLAEMEGEKCSDGPVPSKEEKASAAISVERFYHYLAAGCMAVSFALDPDIIVLSGAVSVRSNFEERLRCAMEKIMGEREMLKQMKSEIRISRLGNDANLYGALYHLLGCMGRI